MPELPEDQQPDPLNPAVVAIERWGSDRKAVTIRTYRDGLRTLTYGLSVFPSHTNAEDPAAFERQVSKALKEALGSLPSIYFRLPEG